MTATRSSSKTTFAATVASRGIETRTLDLRRSAANIRNRSQTPKVTCDSVKGRPDCQLLNLPGELRSDIYSAALLDSHNGLPLLQTCRQVNMESSTVLHQRPISFSSQAKIFSWIAETQSADIKRVKTITLHLTDIDLSSLFDPRPIADRKSGRSTSCWYLYSQELLRLDQALQTLTGLVDLTVVPPEGSTSLMRGLYLSFLEVIPQRCPRLGLLTVYDQEAVLQKVPALRKLVKVVFLSPQDLRGCFTVPVKVERRESAAKIKLETEW